MKNVNKKIKKIKKVKKIHLRKYRKTSLARVDTIWLQVIKEEAKRNKTTISKTNDYLCLNYFGKEAWKSAKKQIINYKLN